jgi:pyruvate/2-oxoglutarate dehydrogenase complex dihydrolipoamide dehydrogenase (E3) component
VRLARVPTQALTPPRTKGGARRDSCASGHRRFGAEVSVIEQSPRLVMREDEEVSAAIREILESEGITVRTGATCIKVTPHASGVAVGVDGTAGAPEIIGSHLLLAVGRRPNTDDPGLDKAGVAIDARGYITVNDELATTAPGIWALDDCNGRGAFTHAAYNDLVIVAANLLDGALIPTMLGEMTAAS